MYFRDDNATFVSPGARLAIEARRLRDRTRTTCDAAASAPLAPIQQLHQRLGEAEKAIAWLCLAEPDDAGGSRDPSDGSESDGEPTGDRRRRSRDDAVPRQDVNPASERDRVAEQLEAQNRFGNGPNRRADRGSMQDDAGDVPEPETPVSVQGRNEKKWPRTESMTGMSQSVPVNSKRAESYVGGNQGGSISGNTSRTQPTLTMGSKTWGVNDSALRQAQIYKLQTARANRDIAAIGDKWASRR